MKCVGVFFVEKQLVFAEKVLAAKAKQNQKEITIYMINMCYSQI